MLNSLLFRLVNGNATINTSPVMPPPPPSTTTFNSPPPGLKTLAATGDNVTTLCRCVSRTSLSTLSMPVDSVSNHNTEDQETDGVVELEHGCWGLYGWRRKPCLFPPAIPLLARTGNLSCHMPWVLKRIYRDDGSLVIQEVPVKHHEYFRASREGGRLTLQHVYLDDKSPIYETGQKTQELADDDDDDDDRIEATEVCLDDDDDDDEEKGEEEDEGDEKIPPPSFRFSERGDIMKEVELPAIFLKLPPINVSSSSLPEPLVLQDLRMDALNIGSPVLCTRCQG